MKKALFILLVLVIIGATGFGFGYIPLRLEPGARAVLFSRTSGWSDTVYEAGEFAWAWQLLIPTNADLYEFSGETRRLSVSSRSSLPSAEMYVGAVDGDPDFSQRVVMSIRYRLSPSGIRSLAPIGIVADTLDQWYDDTDDRITALAAQIIGQVIERGAEQAAENPAGPAPEEIAEEIADRLAERMPQIEVVAVEVTDLHLPDLQLYALARETYFAVQDARRQALIDAARAVAGSEADTAARVQNLQRYGEVLTEFPVLLEYLEIAARNGSDPLDLTSLQLPETVTP